MEDVRNAFVYLHTVSELRLDQKDDLDSDALRRVIANLRQPVGALTDLMELLNTIVSLLSLHHEGSMRSRKSASSKEIRCILPLQETVVQHVLPVWYKVLEDEKKIKSIDLLFGITSEKTHLSPLLGINAFQTLSWTVSREYTEKSLPRLLKLYPVQAAHASLFRSNLSGSILSDAQQEGMWSDHLRVAFGIPGKAMNALGNGAPEMFQPKLCPDILIYHYSDFILAPILADFSLTPSC